MDIIDSGVDERGGDESGQEAQHTANKVVPVIQSDSAHIKAYHIAGEKPHHANHKSKIEVIVFWESLHIFQLRKFFQQLIQRLANIGIAAAEIGNRDRDAKSDGIDEQCKRREE